MTKKSRDLEAVRELVEMMDEEGMVGVLNLHRSHRGGWEAWTDQTIKAKEMPEELVEAVVAVADMLSPSINKIEIVKRRGEVDRIRLHRSV